MANESDDDSNNPFTWIFIVVGALFSAIATAFCVSLVLRFVRPDFPTPLALIEFYADQNSLASYVAINTLAWWSTLFHSQLANESILLQNLSWWNWIRQLLTLFATKIAILFSFVWLWAPVIVAALVDGLVERAKRRTGGGHESATIYHRSKRLAFSSLPLLTVTIFLSWPFPTHANYILVPTIFIWVVSISFAVRYYKKYM